MGRRHIYFCDNCGIDFKNAIHLNVKSAQLNISYPVKLDEHDPTKSEWGSRAVVFENKEYHFCNGKCQGEYVDKRIASMIEKLHMAAQLTKKCNNPNCSTCKEG